MIPLDCFSLYEDAEFYDLEFAMRSHELPYFRDLARRATGSVLEVACGTGRLTIPIALDGVDISGLDVSAPMLARAKKNAAAAGANIEWIEQDCRAMRLDQRYGLIFSATNAMQHLLDVDSACAFLQSARDHLSPDGLLLIDVFNPSISKLLKTPADRHFHKAVQRGNRDPIIVEVSSQYHADRQILYFELFYLEGAEVFGRRA